MLAPRIRSPRCLCCFLHSTCQIPPPSSFLLSRSAMDGSFYSWIRHGQSSAPPSMVARTKDSTDATDAGTWLSTDMLRWSKRQAKAISWYPFMLLSFSTFKAGTQMVHGVYACFRKKSGAPVRFGNLD
ncbi:hypothetical protein PAHAL_4G175400 [Panicum hallii]|uniref:Uncharacterized protein n=1 Tax=Panicum hallii TaxID=206008 RepID=A0A2T8JD82_9POAL|nr:hypothetical protein PAHAL_4G175400 [Panicum hallii]